MKTAPRDLADVWTPEPVAHDSIEVTSGPQDGARVVIRRTPFAIGRSGDSDLVLAWEDAASPVEARIIREGDGYLVEDAGGRGSVRVNGQVVEGRVPLTDHDPLTVATTRLRLRCTRTGAGPVEREGM